MELTVIKNKAVVVPLKPVRSIVRLLIFVIKEIPTHTAITEVKPFKVLAISAACMEKPD